MKNTNQSQECCPEFDPQKWNNKSHKWNDKKFVMDSMLTFFHMPFPPMIGQKINKMWQAVEAKKAAAANKEDTLILFHDPSAFRSEIYISVEKNVSGENNVCLSGDFISQVFDGGYNDIPKFIKEMDESLGKLGKKAIDYYIHYTYCPKCAEKFGHNYMIIFAKV